MEKRIRNMFVIVTLFILLLAVQVAMYGAFFSELKSGSQVVNDLSRVRGTIQRYTKLELANAKIDGQDLEMYIDSVIDYYAEKQSDKMTNKVVEHYDMDNLKASWSDLKIQIGEYHRNPTIARRDAVIRKSEECWRTADAYVIRNQYIANKTASYFKLFTITFGVNLLVIFLMLLFYKQNIHSNLKASAILDPLTGVFNRRYFDEYLKNEIQRSSRKERTFCLVMLDIDNFKQVNDTYGHHRGDYVLKMLTAIILNNIRKSDVLSRVGGEEFMILLPETNRSGAVMVAEKVCTQIASYIFEEVGHVTVSLGLTEYLNTDSTDTMTKRVDTALYQAKANGKNRYEIG